MKLHKIGNSKAPTSAIMSKMAENLRSVYDKPCLVEANHFAYTYTDHPKYPSVNPTYRIYIEDHFNKLMSTWEEALVTYRELMEEAKDGK